jgi:hypothetical protein
MGVKLVSASAGSVEIVAPATASNFTATMPAGSGTVVINGVNSATVSGTAVASTSGTSVNFTGIPSWVKKITLMLDSVSTTGTSVVLVQLGTSAGVTTTGYNSFADSSYGSGVTYTTGFGIERGAADTASRVGIGIIANVSGNNWVFSYNGVILTAAICSGAGSVSLAALLDRVRITTIGGTETFDTGSINILYE